MAITLLDKIVEEIDKLPSPNVVVQRIVAVCSKPDASSTEVANTLMMDASLSARVLKLANSAYYGIPRKITTLSEAVMILGFKTVRNLALSVFTYDMIFKNKRTGVDREKLWEHFIATAVASETVAETTGYPLKEEIFIAGLLHDIGKVVYDFLFSDVLEMEAQIAKKSKRNLIEIEEELGIPPHTEVGAKLLATWNFPDLLVYSADYHHSVEANPNELFLNQVAMVHIGDVLANLMVRGASLSWGTPSLSPFALNALRMKPRTLVRILEKSKEKYERAQEFLKLEE
ncbi:HDOD domain-containing protein [Thermotoga sp. KOL6]|uniref:HDOD domain-containing protein n=1 Tax=Thermotoga sp. KOL6 TaxID=126741 RepID=UPI000C778D43|nr:HDOD domain-containing protein [Thermotoga sp. KOL6]PLV58335.1 phosphodiesterase [Thermotoga sp. KOL6]